MNKMIAILCVVSWSAFWAFGFLAISAEAETASQVMVSAMLAAVGLISGVFAYMHLARSRPVEYRRVLQG